MHYLKSGAVFSLLIASFCLQDNGVSAERAAAHHGARAKHEKHHKSSAHAEKHNHEHHAKHQKGKSGEEKKRTSKKGSAHHKHAHKDQSDVRHQKHAKEGHHHHHHNKHAAPADPADQDTTEPARAHRDNKPREPENGKNAPHQKKNHKKHPAHGGRGTSHSAGTVPTGSNLPAGYIYAALSDDSADEFCAKTSAEIGIPVNTCINSPWFSYKVQLVTDGCAGATVHYYEGADCATYLGELPLDNPGEVCSAFPLSSEVALQDVTVDLPFHFYKLRCTAQPTMPIRVDSAVVELFGGAEGCTQSVGFLSLAHDLCLPISLPRGSSLGSVELRCGADDSVSMVEHAGNSCDAPRSSVSYDGVCSGTEDSAPAGGSLPGLGALTERLLQWLGGGGVNYNWDDACSGSYGGAYGYDDFTPWDDSFYGGNGYDDANYGNDSYAYNYYGNESYAYVAYGNESYADDAYYYGNESYAYDYANGTYAYDYGYDYGNGSYAYDDASYGNETYGYDDSYAYDDYYGYDDAADDDSYAYDDYYSYADADDDSNVHVDDSTGDDTYGSGDDGDEGYYSADDAYYGGGSQAAVLVPPVITSVQASCAVANTQYTAIVSASQDLSVDVSAVADYRANTASYYLVLQKAIAACLAELGVTYTDVFIASVVPGSSSANRGRHNQPGQRRVHAAAHSAAHSAGAPRRTAGKSVAAASALLRVQYTIMSYTAGLSNDDLASELAADVNSGVFDDLLHANAASAGITGLASATSSPVDVNTMAGGDDDTVSVSSEAGPASEGDSQAALSLGAVIGIAVGGGLALILLVAGMVYACWPKAASATSPVDLTGAAPSTTAGAAEGGEMEMEMAATYASAPEPVEMVDNPSQGQSEVRAVEQSVAAEIVEVPDLEQQQTVYV